MSFTIVPSPHSPPHLENRRDGGGVAGEGRGTNGFLRPFLASLRIIVRSLTPKNKAHSAERSSDVSLPLFSHMMNDMGDRRFSPPPVTPH